MASRKWSKGATKALKLIEKNRRKDLKNALKEIDKDPGSDKCAGRNEAVRARIHVEFWRNGWEDIAALRAAQDLARSARRQDPDDFYTNWKIAYSLKYLARRHGGNYMGEALSHYAIALAALRRDEPDNIEALRCVLIDRAEMFVYLSQADTAVEQIMSAPKGKEHDWQKWALSFALHQNGDYAGSIKEIGPLIAGKPDTDLYYNDMRLLLAASQARCRDTAAQKTIDAFRRNRDPNKDEPVWTITLELERGAFYPDSPGEAHWRESLQLLDANALPR